MDAVKEKKQNPINDVKEVSTEDLMKNLESSFDGLSADEAGRRLEKYGPNQLKEKKRNPLLQFLLYFWGPIPWMIEVAAVLSLALNHWVDFAIIAILLAFNSIVGFYQEHQAANAMDALKKNLALKAKVKRDGKWDEIDAARLVPGDVVRLRLGDIIPADVKFIKGDYASVDQSALTGESLPVNKQVGDIGYSGSPIKQGEMDALVVTTGENTYFGKTAKLVSKAGAKSHFQQAVLQVGNFLIFSAIGLVILLVAVELFKGASVGTLVEFALILTVASIPVAMPAVLSVTMALGAVALSKMKAIVSRLESIEEMAGMDVLCSDKTGTLTQNKLTLQNPVPFGDTDGPSVILMGALASKEENQDLIDLAVIKGLDDKSVLDGYEQVEFKPFDPVGKRTEATIKEKGSSETFKVTKGAPQVILDLSGLSEDDRMKIDDEINDFASRGVRTLGVARTDGDGRWKFIGILPLLDPPRLDSAETIRQANKYGIEVKMVTGDNVAIAREISGELGLGTNIHRASEFFKEDVDLDEKKHSIPKNVIRQVENAEGFAEVFPEHKYEIVRALQQGGHIVGMTGDGVNDAPALKEAHTGIAVSGATDAARAAASLILTAPGLSVIINAVEEARKIFERMNSYVIYRIAMTLSIMFFVVASMLAFGFYPLTAVMLILLSLMDDIPIMTIAYDNTWLDPKPVKWQMKKVISVSTVLGVFSLIESFGVLLMTMRWFGLPLPLIETALFLQLVAGGHLLLFVTRTKKHFWTKPGPSAPLFWAIVGTQIIAVLMTGFGLLMPAIPWYLIGIIWVYNFVWMFINDEIKILVYHMMDRGTPQHQEASETYNTTQRNRELSHQKEG